MLARASLSLLAAPLVALSALAAPASAQTTWFVDKTAPGPGTGTATDPYTRIQIAIDAPTTLDGDEVLVRTGDYVETLDFAGKTLRIAPASPTDQVTVNPTSLGRAVTVASGEGPGTTIEGIRLRSGFAPVGAGVLVDGATLRLVDCEIEECRASLDGGGVAARNGGTVELESCVLTGNTATRHGGGVSGPGVRVVGGSIVGNTAGTDTQPGDGGGAIDAVIEDCSVIGNRATRSGAGVARCSVLGSLLQGNRVDAASGVSVVRGGGMIDSDAFDTRISASAAYGADVEGFGVARSTLTSCVVTGHWAFKVPVRGVATFECDLVRCEIRDNFATHAEAAGIGMYGGTARDCFISTNFAPTFTPSVPDGPTRGTVGGGAAAAQLERCLVINNRARHGASLFSCDADRCTIVRCVGESSVAAAAHAPSGSPDRSRLRSCIVAGLTVQIGSVTNQVTGIEPGSMVDAQWCVVEDGWPGTGNLAGDPLLTRVESGDVFLLPGSPAIDAGDPGAPADPDGSRADMGIFPFDPAKCGGPWVTNCGNTVAEASGRASLSGNGALTVTMTQQVPGEVAVPILALASGERIVPELFSICVRGPLTQGTPLAVAPDGTLAWTATPAELAATGALVGDRLFIQLYLPTGGPSQASGRLSHLVETTLCP
ncbi:MAG: right-handed parallel beta-helix repeat-containing protein [Planctomycetota bacterium]